MQRNKIIYVIFAILTAFSIESYNVAESQTPRFQHTPSIQRDDPELAKDVTEALEAIRKDAPQVHQDALRIWKNFRQKSCPPHYTYRYWGIRIILWLKEHKDTAFPSEKKVLEVFQILYHKDLISEHAVLVLTTAAWNYLIYKEGVPDWEDPAIQKPKEAET